MDHDFGDVDLDNLAAVIALQREELEEAGNDAGIDVELLRSQLAFIDIEVQKEKDARMAESIAVANVSDASAIEAIRLKNEEEAGDIEDEEDYEIMMDQARPVTNDLNTLSKLAGRYISPQTGQILHAQAQSGQDTWRVAAQVAQREVPKKDCVACGDKVEFYDVLDARCGHAYCQDCVHQLFTASFKDESLFPPRCCRQPLTEGDIDIFLTRELWDEYLEKEVEFATTNRTYCHFRACSAFIAPANCNSFKGYARCQKCPRLTCLKCKKKHHGAKDCPPDPEDLVLLALAEGEGWQRCGRCASVVEHNTGCYHITCRCEYFSPYGGHSY